MEEAVIDRPYSCLKLQTELAGERSASGLGVDFTKRAGVNIQVGIPWSGMVKDVARIDTHRQVSAFCDANLLLKIRIEVPASGAVDGPQTERAQLSRRCVPQDQIR